TGLNTTGTGLGHKLTGILNEDENNPIDFSNYFTGDLDAGGKSGLINYKFPGLEKGDYKLQVKAWDVFNNPSSEFTFFKVVDGEGLEIEEVYNYPNPFTDATVFTFQHSINQPIDVRISIYTIAGRMIQQIERNSINERFVKIDWDGRDRDGDKVANGTYLYKVRVKSINGDLTKSVLGKLAVIR
ncbi:MAG TPA: FlgD immunoglobulin-like domain containing protein, partial [Ignavibacteriaceae bacterium]|nr:FlgD immunoglobulin-like domain containing protein [Ignavibacteriaceae bacterium]